MSKRIWSIALAYVGVMIGAGVSSGQDLLQYFVSFGAWLRPCRYLLPMGSACALQ